MIIVITRIPFTALQGDIYRSSMPFGDYDRSGQNLIAMKQNHISVVVMLVSDQEARRKTGKNLRQLYQAEGIDVIHLPVEDFNIPEREALDRAIDQVIGLANQGRSICVHCSAGIGRTGLFIAELAKKAQNLPGEDAIEWVRSYIPGAVETSEQKRFVIAESTGEKSGID